MDKNIGKTLDLLCADKIDVGEAADMLNMSVEEVFELVDDYTYIPTSEEVVEVCEIERRTLNHIKAVALQNMENKVRSKLTRPLNISVPSFTELMKLSDDCLKILIPGYVVSTHKVYSPLGPKIRHAREIGITSGQGGYAHYMMPDSYCDSTPFRKGYGFTVAR
jgi:hypothetical protein